MTGNDNQNSILFCNLEIGACYWLCAKQDHVGCISKMQVALMNHVMF